MFALQHKKTKRFFRWFNGAHYHTKVFPTKGDFCKYLIEQGYAQSDFHPYELVEIQLIVVEK